MRQPGDIVILIGPDGRVYFDGLPEDLLDLAAQLCPDDPAIRRRLTVRSRVRGGRERPKEEQHGVAAPGA